MNPYEQKVQARLDRLRARAERKRGEAAAAFASADRIAQVIPMGQPILVGHHSEKRHRRDIARIDSGMRRGVDATKEAEALERRAHAAEHNRAVSSDDPDAVEKLQDKLDGIERLRARMVEANAAIRTAKRAWDKDPDKASKLWTDAAVAALGALGISAPLARELVKPDFMGRIGYANYQLTNAGSEARRVRERIRALQAAASREAPAPEHYGPVRVEEADNRVRVYFPGKPAQEIRTLLQSRGFKWARSEGAWQRHAGGQAWYEAREIAKRFGPKRESACAQCGKSVEQAREAYAIPTCYACLPPPEPLPVSVRAREYTLDDEPMDLVDFLDANPRDDNPEVDPDEIARLEVGGEIRYGGGAAPLTVLRRVR